VSQRILEALGEPYVLPGYLHHSTCSIGVTLFGKTPSSVSELLKQADLAMYQAKAAGRNAVRFFDPEMQAWRRPTRRWPRTCARPGARTTCGSSTSRRWGRRRMVGVEALLRWEHPERGIVQPGAVHPDRGRNLADHPDRPLGAGARLRAARGLGLSGRTGATWHLGQRQRAAVPPSGVRRRRDGMAVAKANIGPGKLKLELTESLLADGLDVTIAKMRSLKEMGVACRSTISASAIRRCRT
jgi:predicted signal transduction protein with EAL and GGDEF domain